MANDQSWQRRSDEWVKASHESRKRKEAGMTRPNKAGAGNAGTGNVGKSPVHPTPDGHSGAEPSEKR